jgi:hypothetical protein
LNYFYWLRNLALTELSESDLEPLLFGKVLVDNNVVLGGCSEWSIFLSSLALTYQSPNKISQITLFDASSLQTDPGLIPTLSCADEKEADTLVSALANRKEVKIDCSGSTWSLLNCGSGSYLCVNCSSSCDSSLCLTMNSSPGIGCGLSCPALSLGRVRMIAISLVARTPPPVVISMNWNVSAYSTSVLVILSHPGLVYCAALSPATSVSSVGLDAILSKGFASPSLSVGDVVYSMVSISGLRAATPYNVFCTTQSVDGSKMSQATMQSMVK